MKSSSSPRHQVATLQRIHNILHLIEPMLVIVISRNKNTVLHMTLHDDDIDLWKVCARAGQTGIVTLDNHSYQGLCLLQCLYHAYLIRAIPLSEFNYIPNLLPQITHSLCPYHSRI